MTPIKRADLAAFFDRELQRDRAYVLSAIVDGMRECGMLRWSSGQRSWAAVSFAGLDPDKHYGLWVISPSGCDLPWSDVEVYSLRSWGGKLLMSDDPIRFTPPKKTITHELADGKVLLEVDEEKWGELNRYHEVATMRFGEVSRFIDSAKEVK